MEAKPMKNDITLVYESKPELNKYLASVRNCTEDDVACRHQPSTKPIRNDA
ncbi:MAG: hypothetical protein MZU97_05570 [Bacillus subtilis]|nr:hypothetical protein [Bacillus subtilis]